MGVAAWYREDGELAEDTIVWQYGDFALRLAGAGSESWRGVSPNDDRRPPLSAAFLSA